MPPPLSRRGASPPFRCLPPGRGRGQSPRSNVVILTLVLLLSLVPAGRVGAAYEQIVVKDGGVLAGVVKLAGAPPRLEPIHVNKNPDPILHNTHGFHAGAAGSAGKLTVFNLALPNAGQVIEITRKLVKPGPVRVLCDAHTHMFGWLYVHDSPYVAVTDERGAFRIDGVPPGRYRVTMWHEGFRPQGVDKDGRPLYDGVRTVTKEVTIAPNATATVEFELR